MPAEGRRLSATCWVVLAGHEHEDARPSLHHVAHSVHQGQNRMVGYRERVELVGILQPHVVFHGWPSLQEAWAYAAGAGFARHHVVERPIAP